MVEVGTLKDLDEAVDLAIKLQRNEATRCRSLLIDCSRKDLFDYFKRYIERDNEDLLIIKDDGRIVAVTPYYWMDEDNYVSYSQGPYALDFEVAIKKFNDYIESKFKGYKLHANVAPEHKMAVTFYKENGFEIAETAKLIKLEDVKDCRLETNIVALDDSNKEEVLSYIDKVTTSDVYWNAKRLSQKLDKFVILVSKDKEITGHIIGRGSYKYTEMIALTGTDEDKKRLIKSFIGACYRNKISKIDIYAETELEEKLALDHGFSIYDQTICLVKYL